jgi:CRP-like cAMP-binding protein
MVMPPEIAEKVAAFFAQYPERQFARRHVLIEAGEDPKGAYYLTKGTVRQYDITAKGDEVVVNVFKPFAFFPMSHTVNKMPNDYFYEAAEDMAARFAPAQAVLTFLQDNPDVMFDLLRRVYSGVEGLLRRQAQLMNGTAMSRLSYELLIACRRFGRALPDGTWFVNIREADFASRSGLTRETVSRCLHKLKAEGCLDVVRGGVVVKDVATLEREANAGLVL